MNKQKFNLHTHTARCGHAEGLDIQYIHSAIDAGLTLLGFSEHIPYPEMHLPAVCSMNRKTNTWIRFGICKRDFRTKSRSRLAMRWST